MERQFRFPRLDDRDDLRQVLFVPTTRKAVGRVRYETREKPECRRAVQGFTTGRTSPGEPDALASLVGSEPTNELAAEVAQGSSRLLAKLGDGLLLRVAILKMEGCTSKEIDRTISRAESTVQRRLKHIREIWGASVGKDDGTPRRASASRVVRLEDLYDRYESAWRAGRRPDPAVYLAEVEDADRPAVRGALAQIDAEYIHEGTTVPPALPGPQASVPLKLVVTAGPHTGRTFDFHEHDTFLVGRSKESHFQFSYDDPYFSRQHFLVEVNPPRIRVFDLNSRNGIAVNGAKVRVADLNDGDELRAGHTVFRVILSRPAEPAEQATLGLPAAPPQKAPKPFPMKQSDPAVGLTIPGYRLGAEIGRGAMGTVFRAVRESDAMPVAVKVISLVEGVTARQVDKFFRESRILAELDHQNIVRYLDRGQVPGLVYLAMELVEGPDAARIVKRSGPLDVSTAVRIMRLALEGLAHAHERKVVHRDVKPANVIVGGPKEKRVVKVADFGLARSYEASGLSGRTLHGEVGGTPAFMAPEQVTHYRDVMPAADQYSAAATLYYLLTGKYVLNFGANSKEHLVQIVTEERIPILTHRPDLPAGLAAVIHKAMSMEPEKRYPGVTAFRNALKPFAKQ